MEEEQQLLNFYSSFEKPDTDLDFSPLGDKMLNRLMQSPELQDSDTPQLQDSGSLESDSNTRKPSAPLWKKISIAASFLIVSAAVSWFYLNQKEPEVEQFAEISIKNDIDPGDNKAVLILGDGSHISLDDAANGLVASQGNISITKTDEGQIVYKRNNSNLKAVANRISVNTIKTPRGGRYQVRLPDGSRVWLNSASTLSYPTSFRGSERRVKLIGEAYFEIAKNEHVPFRVESNNQVVEVLGTHFNVNSYEDEDYIKTTLLEGSVKIILNASDRSSPNIKLLKPGEQSLTSGAQPKIRVESTDIEKAVAWKNGYFKFKNTPIKDIMREIERWYDVELIYDGKMPSDEFTGYISNDVKMSSVLKILEQSGGVKFTVKGKQLKIKSLITLN